MVSHLHASKTVVFYDPEYPQFCTEATLHRLVPGSFQLVDAAHLAEHLGRECSLLLSFHGAYFPKTGWQALLSFLESGGNLAIFGGMPFSRLVQTDGTVEPEQDTYTRQLYLGAFYRISPSSSRLQLVADDAAVLLRDCRLQISEETPGTFWSFYPGLTQASDHPEDMGSAGPFDTVIQPLIYAQSTTASERQQRQATPALLLDQRSGRFRGGRWLLSAWQPASEKDWLANVEAIQRLILLAAQGITSFDLRPTLGCYQSGEALALVATARTAVEVRARVTVYQPACVEALPTFDLVFPPSPVLQEQLCKLSLQQPGLYTVEVEYQPQNGLPLMLKSGFWIWDEALIESTRKKRLTAGRDYFYQEHELFLVFGTTYMDSRVQRKFLHLPDPARWDRDLAEMKATGINLIRTGIWSAWREFVPVAGVINEVFLRALDAFVLTACKQNIQVIFTLFCFFPPLFEGENPWLDPRSLEAQQDFVAVLARRYAQVELLSWDLINEPSFGNPERIFSQRPLPNYDRYEAAAFREWLQEQYTLNELQLRWRQTPGDLPDWSSVFLPVESDYNASIQGTTIRAMLKVADYTRFSQEMFRRWAAQMVLAIRASGGQTLVGVGQDEASSRIAPQFYAEAVDYTTTHPWWNIDELLWDMLLDKTPDKPNLIQETGVMQLRDIDGRPWRTEQENADLLERKLVMGLIARGAGLVQWLWHINGYMQNDNENSIGLVRLDGSAKPELFAMEEFGRLTQALAGRLLEAPALPDVWVVIPYSQWFVRPDLARQSTRQAIRVLGYDLGVIPQMVSEFQLQRLNTERPQPRTIIVPAVQLLDQQAWQSLLAYVQKGGTLLLSGIIGRDAHNLFFHPGIDGVAEDLALLPVSRYEELEDSDGRCIPVTFADEKISYVRKAHNYVQRITYGSGTLIWSGLPLELANGSAATRSLYAQALKLSSNLDQGETPVVISRRPLLGGTLIMAVSEAHRARHLVLDEGLEVTIEPNRAGALILDDGPDQMVQTFGGLHR